jgi:hypothetical protein
MRKILLRIKIPFSIPFLSFIVSHSLKEFTESLAHEYFLRDLVFSEKKFIAKAQIEELQFAISNETPFHFPCPRTAAFYVVRIMENSRLLFL